MSLKVFSSVKNALLSLSQKVGKNCTDEFKNVVLKPSKKTIESQDVFQKVIVPNPDSTKKLLGYIAGIGTVGSIGTVGAIETSKTINSTTARQERPKTLKSTTA